MMLSSELSELLDTEMDRKEFLAYAGATVLAVVGVSGLLKMLTAPLKSKSVSSGYGSSVYGGNK